MTSYEEIADAYKMTEVMKARYVEYMKTRWSETELRKCLDGYAEIWAGRFVNLTEWDYSDDTGIAILKEMNNV